MTPRFYVRYTASRSTYGPAGLLRTEPVVNRSYCYHLGRARRLAAEYIAGGYSDVRIVCAVRR